MLNSTMDRSGRGQEKLTFLDRLFESAANLFGTTSMAGNDNLVIIDISYWQDDRIIDYDVLCKNIDAVILRASYAIWEDTRFKIHYENFSRRGIPVGAYTYTIGNVDPIQQARTFYNAVKGCNISAGFWHDVEDRRVNTRLTPSVVNTITKELDRLLGEKIDIYTGVYAWPDIMGTQSNLYGDRKLWIANYGVTTPRMPIRGSWTEPWLWQFTESGRLPGYDRNLDINRFWKSDKVFYQWVGGMYKPEPEEKPESLFKAKCIVHSLNVRLGPGMMNPVVGGLSRNDIVDVYDVQNNWFAINDSLTKWVSGHEAYMKKITEEPEKPVEPEDPIDPTGPLTELYYPCEEGRWRISQYFGERPHTYTQSRGHNGLDWAIPVGQPIYCAWDGIVEVAREDTFGYGRHIRIRHSHGITIYGHMSRNDVKVGDRVKAKQQIGLSGGAVSDPYGGFTTGPHLHFEYRWDITAPQVPGGYKYNAVDPFPLLISHVKEEPLFHIKVKVTALNVRSGPAVSFGHLHLIRRDEVYKVYEERNGWFRLGQNRWCSGDSAYVEKIGDDVTPQPPQDEILFRAKCLVFLLNVRDSAGLTGRILWQLKEGDVVNVYEEKLGWYRISDKKQEWCSGNAIYMRKI